MKTSLLNRFTPCLAAVLLASPGLAQNLPFESASDGSDGAFSVPIVDGFSQRQGHSGAYDPVNNEVVVFGGSTFTEFGKSLDSVAYLDVLRWNGSSWRTAERSGLSAYSYQGAMGFDKASGTIVYYGGSLTGGNLSYTTVSKKDGDWIPRNNSKPGLLRLTAMAYDEVNSALMMVGGLRNDRDGTDATWAFDSTQNDWNRVETKTTPGRIYGHQMCWDSSRKEMVLFGGFNSDSNEATSDVWIWDPAASNWSKREVKEGPSARWMHQLGYDPGSGKVILHGGWDGKKMLRDTWEWNGVEWIEVTGNRMMDRHSGTMVTDEGRKELLLIGGAQYGNGEAGDTWVWDGVSREWVQKAGNRYWVDLNEKADGVYNFTTIDVRKGMTVQFMPNSLNSAVVWQATGDVTINGSVDVSGSTGFLRGADSSVRAPGGPGGFAGGLGGITSSGTPGDGPGAGAPSVDYLKAGDNGSYAGVYGNAYIVPLIGGSGGGGAAAGVGAAGGNGGGGGGALMIVSSRNITVNGTILANGGSGGSNSDNEGQTGGNGSGGAIKLVGDRILGTGQITSVGGSGTAEGTQGGYIRLEGYEVPLSTSGMLVSSEFTSSAPTATLKLSAQPSLTVAEVAGAGVADPAQGDFSQPDVVFSNSGTVRVTVKGANIPDGVPVTLRITSGDKIINLPDGGGDVVLKGGVAEFSTTVPAGLGTIQAFAIYDVEAKSL